MIGNKEWVLKHSSYYHTEKDGTTKRVEFNATKQPEELKNKILHLKRGYPRFFYLSNNSLFSIKSSSGDLSLATIKPGSYWL